MATDWHVKSLIKDEDFQEDEVWAIGKVVEESNSRFNKSEKLKRYIPPPPLPSSSSSSSSYAWTSIDGAGAPRTISKGSMLHHHHQQQKQQQSSIPVRIPDWSKIHRKKPIKDSGDGCYKDDHDVNVIYGNDEMIPPHEYINRRVARSQIAPFSMCEGVGRTLKGRDLTKLRNAILTKTGFLE